MARIDKYDPVDGGFRAPLAAAWTGSATPIGVGLNGSGRVVPGAGNTGVIGVLCKPDDAAAGDVVDVMTDGELVEFAGAAGSVYYAAAAAGAISTTNTGTKIGHTVEASRLIVRMGRAGATQFAGEQANIVALTDNTDGAAPDDTIADIPAVVAAAGEATAADLTTTQAALAALEDAVGELAAKINTIITTLDAANVTA